MSNLNDDGENTMEIDKSIVLQEAKQQFMSKSVKQKKLLETLTKCIVILSQGEKLDNKEASNLFLQITQLFQYKDRDSSTNTLRRLIYIGIKALSQQADNAFVVTSSLTNDITTSADPAIKASALRALCQISDSSNYHTIERYLKQGVVDKHPVVASAALTSLIRIGQVNNEIVERCTNEVQEALKSNSPMVQYHALGLRYNSCKNDRLAISRLISNCSQQGLHSPLATCLLIKIITKFINDNTEEEALMFKDYIKNQLNHSSELVEYEAANALVLLGSNASESDQRSAVSHLRNFLTSKKAALRFASVRSLNELQLRNHDLRFWTIHRIGGVCKLHLLNKRYRVGDHIVGILDFSNSTASCAKYTVILQCEETQQYELKQEFSLGVKKKDFMIAIPLINTKASVLHCVLSFLFYIGVKNYPKILFEDRAGTIELGPNQLETKLFSCDFPIAVHT